MFTPIVLSSVAEAIAYNVTELGSFGGSELIAIICGHVRAHDDCGGRNCRLKTYEGSFFSRRIV